MIFAFGKFALQAYGTAREQGWKPKQVFINDVASAASLMVLSPPQITEGSISIVFAKDPGLARWKNDKGMKLFGAVMKKYFPRGVDDGYAAAGMASAFTMVDTLKKAGKNLSRASVIRAATHLNETNNPLLLPGIAVHTTPSFRFPVAQAALQRWHNGKWVIFTPVQPAKP
jgi:hypothetical protein